MWKSRSPSSSSGRGRQGEAKEARMEEEREVHPLALPLVRGGDTKEKCDRALQPVAVGQVSDKW
jgi:hypothetical protein